MYKVVLIRHGESMWNKKNYFNGWVDTRLSLKGIKEAKRAAKALKKEGFVFDIVFTSFLRRAIKTTDIILTVMGLKNIKVEKSWKLNERHYGALQGKNKSKTAKKYGKKQTHIWRRSWDTKPPALKKTDKYWPGNYQMYKGLKDDDLPLTESLKDASGRILDYWQEKITPAIKQGKSVLVSGHGSGMRALVKHLDNISDKDIANLNIPTGIPLVYELNDNLKPIRHYYLGSKKMIKMATRIVRDQDKANHE